MLCTHDLHSTEVYPQVLYQLASSSTSCRIKSHVGGRREGGEEMATGSEERGRSGPERGRRPRTALRRERDSKNFLKILQVVLRRIKVVAAADVAVLNALLFTGRSGSSFLVGTGSARIVAEECPIIKTKHGTHPAKAEPSWPLRLTLMAPSPTWRSMGSYKWGYK